LYGFGVDCDEIRDKAFFVGTMLDDCTGLSASASARIGCGVGCGTGALIVLASVLADCIGFSLTTTTTMMKKS